MVFVGVAGGRGGVDEMSEPVSRKQFVYGTDASEYGHLWVPATDELLPVVVLIHGGFWRRAYESDLMEPLAWDLFERGYAVWNLEYGRVGEAKGGWPYTLAHVASGIDHLSVLADDYPLDLDRVGVVGHSAGGHLALWSGSRNLLPGDATGSQPVVEPALVVGLGAVGDLAAAAAGGIGNDAVIEFLGGNPEDVPGRFVTAQPQQGAARILLVSGDQDSTVELQYSRWPGLLADEIVVEGADHMVLIEPENESWLPVLEALATL